MYIYTIYIYKNLTTFHVQMFKYTLHLHFGPNQILIYSLNLGNVSDFIFDGRLCHFFGPKYLNLWVANLLYSYALP